jgi:hypothetical protein
MKNNDSTMVILKARSIGSFLLLAFFAFGFGQYFFESENTFEKYFGALLIILNAIIVLFIGILLKKTLRLYSLLIGNIYLITRTIEAIVLASIVLNLIPSITISADYLYFISMLILGLGSIPMCLSFYNYKILPPWFALWGVIGYTLFAFGFLMELFGKPWSMYLLIFAGLWEIFFALWLIIKRGPTNLNTNF